MKKALSLLLALLSLLALASCSAVPRKDYNALKKDLDAKGYGAGVTELQTNAESFGSEHGITLCADGFEAMLMATKTNESYDIVDMIVIFYFESDSAAEKAFESGNYEKLFQKMVTSYKSDNAVDLKYNLHGSMFWIGTDGGIADCL